MRRTRPPNREAAINRMRRRTRGYIRRYNPNLPQPPPPPPPPGGGYLPGAPPPPPPIPPNLLKTLNRMQKSRVQAAKKIQTAWRARWKKVELNNLPNQDPISYNNFRNGNKAIKLTWKTGGKNHHAYFTPKTIAALIQMRNTSKAMKLLQNTNSSDVVFKNPLFGGSWVKRKDINFVILTRKPVSLSTRRKLAANAANKRATAFRTRGVPASKRKSKK